MRIKNKKWDFKSMVNEFLNKRYLLNMGAGKIGKTYSLDRNTVKMAKAAAKNIIKEHTEERFPKILIFDIETSPLEAYVWQKEVWRASINDDKIMTNWFMISWAAKWLFSDVVISDVLKKEEVLNEDDSRIVKSLWKLFNEADIIIAHNAESFDVPNMNTRFVYHDMMPPAAYQMIDTLKVARRQFGFTHNSLNALAKFFGIDAKIETNFNLWVKCKKGDGEALKEMKDYNKHDVEILEMVYLKLRPWIKSHPNIGLFLESDRQVCPTCGGKVVSTGDFYHTMTGKYPTYRCTNPSCRTISRGRSSVYPKGKRKALITSVSR